MSKSRTALVIVLSNINTDPRVVRQVEWLTEEGWAVDSLALGETPAAGTRDHFAMTPPARWTRVKLGLGLLHTLPYRARFSIIAESRFPEEVGRRVANGSYDLIIFNDTHLIPWIANRRIFTEAAAQAHIHLDLHEYFPPELKADIPFRFLLAGYYAWGRGLIASPLFSTRSTVAARIADLYQSELGGPAPAIVRNAPPFVDQAPSAVSDSTIKLLHHGVAAWERGLREIVEAVCILGKEFEVTFMLTGSQAVISELSAISDDVRDRVHIVAPVPMDELARAVNKFDLEVMFYKPRSTNLLFAFPNKLFEAIQGRLGLVIGESPTMSDVVTAHENGIIAKGWTGKDLATALSTLTADDVRRFKTNSDTIAKNFSAENERTAFFASIDMPKT